MRKINIRIADGIFVTVNVSEDEINSMIKKLKDIHDETTKIPVEEWSNIPESAAVKKLLNHLPAWLYAYRNYPEFGQIDYKPLTIDDFISGFINNES